MRKYRKWRLARSWTELDIRSLHRSLTYSPTINISLSPIFEFLWSNVHLNITNYQLTILWKTNPAICIQLQLKQPGLNIFHPQKKIDIAMIGSLLKNRSYSGSYISHELRITSRARCSQLHIIIPTDSGFVTFTGSISSPRFRRNRRRIEAFRQAKTLRSNGWCESVMPAGTKCRTIFKASAISHDFLCSFLFIRCFVSFQSIKISSHTSGCLVWANLQLCTTHRNNDKREGLKKF